MYVCVGVCKTNQAIELGDADLIWVYHTEVPPGDQIQSQLPIKPTHTHAHLELVYSINLH